MHPSDRTVSQTTNDDSSTMTSLLSNDAADTYSDTGSEECTSQTPRMYTKEQRDAVLAAAAPLDNVNGWDLTQANRYMIKLAAQGSVDIVRYDGSKPLKADADDRADSANLPTPRGGGEWYHRPLRNFTVAPYGTVYVHFFCLDLSTTHRKLAANKHVPGCFGDVYLVAHFETNEGGMEYSDGRQLSPEDFDFDHDVMPSWMKTEYSETYGIMPTRPEVFYWLVYELRFKSLYYFNEFVKASANVMRSVLATVADHAPDSYGECQRACKDFTRKFEHPEAEFMHTSATMSHPRGMDVQLIRSFASLKAYSDGLVAIGNRCIARTVKHFRIRVSMEPFMFDGFEIDCPGMDCRSYATCVSKVWGALYERVRMQVAASAAARARRTQIHDAMMAAEAAEAKAKEQRRKAAAVESRAAKAAAGEAPLTPRGAPRPSQRADKKAARQQHRTLNYQEATVAALTHSVHILPEQKTVRREAAELHKEAAHHERIAREEREKVVRLRDLDKSASAAREAATHYVPGPSTINDVLCDALEKASV